MNRFSLPHPTVVTVEHINIRDEHHGDETALAIDLKLSLEANNDVLEQFEPGMVGSFYRKGTAPAARAGQAALDLEKAPDLNELRFPNLDTQKWHEDLEDRIVTLDYGITGASKPLTLQPCKVNEFRMEMKQGGTVRVTFRVQHSEPDEGTLGKVGSLLKRQVRATIRPSAEMERLIADNEAMAAQAAPKSRAKKAAAPQDATDAFLAQHGGDSRPAA